MYFSMNVVMIFVHTRRKLLFLMYTTPRFMNTKWLTVKLLKNLQRVEAILFASHVSLHDTLCRCVERLDTDIKNISCMPQFCLLPQRLAPVSQLFNSSNAGQLSMV